jgi:prepilin-type N-terminal cleavage/methylation domain-containing protein
MKFRRHNFYSAQSAFTMIEIAISLAVIGIALVAIIGVLPLGMNVQKDNREETVIDQDATVFIEAIRGGASSPFGADLTNYVYLITNTVTSFNNSGVPSASQSFYSYNGTYLTNNARIIGLMSAPEFTNNAGNPINNVFSGGYSNHVVAYVRSISGPAVEKPPQDNPILQQDSFSYKIIFDNMPVATPDLNVNSSTFATNYTMNLTANLHELRLTFLWPLLPNGDTGGGRQTFRTMVGGQIYQTNDIGVTPNQPLYFFQPQSFTNVNISP